MASTPTSKHSLNEDINGGTSGKSYFQKAVCLKEWWLVKADEDVQGKWIAIAGFTSREKQAVRIFSSAPILKRYDSFTLETVDGICVVIQGLMNKARTKENGFPSEICNHFVLGFPFDWEMRVGKISEGNSILMGEALINQDFGRFSLQNAMQSRKDPNKANSSKKVAKQIFFSREADLSEELSCCSEGRGTTCSQANVQGKLKNNRMSSNKLKAKKIIAVSVSLRDSGPKANLDVTPRGKSTLNPPGAEFPALKGQMASRNADVRSSEDNVELDHVTSKDTQHAQNHDGVQENHGMQHEFVGYFCSSGANSGKGKIKKKISNAEKSNSPCESWIPRNSRRKSLHNPQSANLFKGERSRGRLDSPVSQKEKEKSSIMPPESLHLKRSRSGRWLLPSLAFWRNQRVIYDADHEIIGIKDLN